MVEAEKIRDVEFSRLKMRHLRDKQLISALKLKIERQQLELTRAADVPEHEAEAYLDLIEGNLTSSIVKTRRNAGAEEDGTMQYEGSSEGEEEEEEMSMKGLLQQQAAKAEKHSGSGGTAPDLMDAAWTAQLIEEQEKRRKLFAKKRKQE